jgi:hypothetical protein
MPDIARRARWGFPEVQRTVVGVSLVAKIPTTSEGQAPRHEDDRRSHEPRDSYAATPRRRTGEVSKSAADMERFGRIERIESSCDEPMHLC